MSTQVLTHGACRVVTRAIHSALLTHEVNPQYPARRLAVEHAGGARHEASPSTLTAADAGDVEQTADLARNNIVWTGATAPCSLGCTAVRLSDSSAPAGAVACIGQCDRWHLHESTSARRMPESHQGKQLAGRAGPGRQLFGIPVRLAGLRYRDRVRVDPQATRSRNSTPRIRRREADSRLMMSGVHGTGWNARASVSSWGTCPQATSGSTERNENEVVNFDGARNDAVARCLALPTLDSPARQPVLRVRSSSGASVNRNGPCERAPISPLNENNHGFWPDAVMLHRRSACFTLHDRLKRVHVGDVHRQADSIGSIRLNERADVLRHSGEHLFTLLR